MNNELLYQVAYCSEGATGNSQVPITKASSATGLSLIKRKIENN